MAASKPSSASEDEMTSLIECGICLLEMVNPKALPCLHSFCLECLKEVKHPPGIFLCPLCQEKTILPPEGVDGFRNNFFIKQLKERKTISGKGKINKPCASCNAEGCEIAARCVDCNGFICPQCAKLHQTLNLMKAHTVFTIDELQSGNIDISKMIKEENCKKHKDQVLRWFCKSCNIPICRDCTVMDHVRPDHNYITVESAHEAQVKEIKALMANCKGLTQQLMNAIVNTEEEESNLKNSVNNIKKQLGEEKKAYLEAIERGYKEMMDKLSQIQAEKAEKINVTKLELQNTKSKLTNAVQVANQVITSGSKHDLASNYSSLCKTLADLQHIEISWMNTGCSEIKFRPSQKHEIKSVDMGSVSSQKHEIKSVNMGSVSSQKHEIKSMDKGSVAAKGPNPKDRNGKWVLDRELGKEGVRKIMGGCGVTVNKKNNILIADYSDKNIKIFESDGTYKGVLQGNFRNPRDIVMPRNETHQYITDNTGFVHVFDSQGKEVKQFPAVSPGGIKSDTDGSRLCGLAVDNDGNILVVNNTKHYISKHKPDATHICSFKTNFDNPRFIDVTHQGRIIVCPCNNKNAEILDHNGKLLHTINKPPDAKSWCPTGCCCSDDGIVYVTSYASSNYGGVYSFTEDGTYLGCVTTDVIQAEGIALIDDDRLVVAQYNGHPAKIFCYKET